MYQDWLTINKNKEIKFPSINIRNPVPQDNDPYEMKTRGFEWF